MEKQPCDIKKEKVMVGGRGQIRNWRKKKKFWAPNGPAVMCHNMGEDSTEDVKRIKSRGGRTHGRAFEDGEAGDARRD